MLNLSFMLPPPGSHVTMIELLGWGPPRLAGMS